MGDSFCKLVRRNTNNQLPHIRGLRKDARMDDQIEPDEKHMVEFKANESTNSHSLYLGSKDLRKKSRSAPIQSCDSLLREALTAHLHVEQGLYSALKYAIEAGGALNALRARQVHGDFIKFIDENFCSVNGISIRTAQRYMQLARNFGTLVEKLRSERDVVGASISSDKLIENVPIKRALALLKMAGMEFTPSDPSTCDSLPGHNEWLTPEPLAKQISTFLGVVDFDPCALDTHNTVQASKKTILPVDGLSFQSVWHGRVYVCPGLTRVNHQLWVEKALGCYFARTIDEAIVLVPALTNTAWATSTHRFPRAFFRGPLLVQVPNQTSTKTIKQPAMMIFISKSDRFENFAEAFCDTHDVFMPVSSD